MILMDLFPILSEISFKICFTSEFKEKSLFIQWFRTGSTNITGSSACKAQPYKFIIIFPSGYAIQTEQAYSTPTFLLSLPQAQLSSLSSTQVLR